MPCASRRMVGFWGAAGDSGKRWNFIQAKFFLRKLMRPLVDESWELTSAESWSSGSIFFASCFPSSTLIIETSQTSIYLHENRKKTFLYLESVQFSCFSFVFVDISFMSHHSLCLRVFSLVAMVTHWCLTPVPRLDH